MPPASAASVGVSNPSYSAIIAPNPPLAATISCSNCLGVGFASFAASCLLCTDACLTSGRLFSTSSPFWSINSLASASFRRASALNSLTSAISLRASDLAQLASPAHFALVFASALSCCASSSFMSATSLSVFFGSGTVFFFLILGAIFTAEPSTSPNSEQ